MVTAISVELNIFMNKLAKINPKSRMIGEVAYWEFMASILSPAKIELETENNKQIISFAKDLSFKIK